MQTDVDLSRINVLVVDSSRFARAFAISALEAMGLKSIREAGSGSEALEMPSAADIQLLVVERDLTPMSGIDFTRRVRGAQTALPQDVTILMTSGEDSREVVAEARNAGVNEFMVKPVAADALFRRVRSALLHPKPFVRTPAYTGPDRRILDRPIQNAENRRQTPPLPKPPPLVDPPCAHAAGLEAPSRDLRAEMRFPAGHLIFSDGDRGEEAYVVQSGRVLIFKAMDGIPVPLGTIMPGGVFGEMALIDDEPRMASARAEEDTVCSVIPVAALKSLLGRTPDLVVLVLETLLHDIRKMGRELGQVRAALEKRQAE